VTVTAEGGCTVLEVADDGCGFDPAAARDRTHFGLRGLASLVADAGGTLSVVTAPGRGTTLRLEVSR
jgi:signal transduction histidine kinase